MSYQALYRKFRPECFADVKGQDAIVTTLQNQIRTGRIGHAYLFCGTRGTGKTTVAKIFARAVNCEHPSGDGSPCGECDTCRGIADGTLLNVIEIDAASNNGVDNIRTIIDEISYSPTKGKKKVYIIDEVHMLSAGAFNALLKTLEEPPEYALFILATTDVQKVPITILSRCQRYDFHRMSVDTMADRMRELVAVEGAKVDDKALSFIARCADGSMRDALSLLDQCLAFNYGQDLTYDKALDVLGAADNSVYSAFMESIINADLAGAVKILDDHIMKGREITAFVNDFIWYMRNLLLLGTSDKGGADISEVLGVSSDTMAQMKAEAKKIRTETLMRYISIFSELSGEIKFSAQKRVLTEIAIVKLIQPRMDSGVDAYSDRLAQVERKLDKIEKEGVKTAAVAAAPPAPVRQKPDAPVPDALPEDVKVLVANWKKVIAAVKAGGDMALKNLLESASPSFDGNKVMIKSAEQTTIGLLQSPENKEQLENVFESITGKKIPFDFYSPAEGEGINEKLPDLSKFIMEDIEIVSGANDAGQEAHPQRINKDPAAAQDEVGGSDVSEVHIEDTPRTRESSDEDEDEDEDDAGDELDEEMKHDSNSDADEENDNADEEEQ